MNNQPYQFLLNELVEILISKQLLDHVSFTRISESVSHPNGPPEGIILLQYQLGHVW